MFVYLTCRFFMAGRPLFLRKSRNFSVFHNLKFCNVAFNVDSLAISNFRPLKPRNMTYASIPHVRVKYQSQKK